MSPGDPERALQSRRTFLTHLGGLGCAALGALTNPRLFAAPPAPEVGNWPGSVRPLHHSARAKRMIVLFMAGGPSQFETFDPKPKLAQLAGQPIPPSVVQGQSLSPNSRSTNTCVAPQFEFHRRGKCGHPMTTMLPHTAEVADDLCMIHSMTTDSFVHDLALTMMSTGALVQGRPALGSWAWYGLGSVSDNLPGFVVLRSGAAGSHPLNKDLWSNGFLPTRFQGVQFRSKGDVVHYLNNPKGVTRTAQQSAVRAIQELDRLSPHAAADPEVATHVAQYETAFRMQTSVPDLVDLSSETAETLDLYGIRALDDSFASNCLLARRLAERDVRFVQLIHLDWDHHYGVRQAMQQTAPQVDRGIKALLTDLKRRGMLDDTLVVWGGEFGRTPVAQESKGEPGRDHHNKCFTMWMAGGGVKAGYSHGESDDFGFNVVRDPVHVHDLHATILHLMGIDHERLTVRFQGRDFRLTDVSGSVVKQILA